MAVENWIHPFVESLSDAIVENLQEGATCIRKFVSSFAPKAKDLNDIQSAMQHYRDNQLPHDEPMKALILTNPKLQNVFGTKNKIVLRIYWTNSYLLRMRQKIGMAFFSLSHFIYKNLCSYLFNLYWLYLKLYW